MLRLIEHVEPRNEIQISALGALEVHGVIREGPLCVSRRAPVQMESRCVDSEDLRPQLGRQGEVVVVEEVDDAPERTGAAVTVEAERTRYLNLDLELGIGFKIMAWWHGPPPRLHVPLRVKGRATFDLQVRREAFPPKQQQLREVQPRDAVRVHDRRLLFEEVAAVRACAERRRCFRSPFQLHVSVVNLDLQGWTGEELPELLGTHQASQDHVCVFEVDRVAVLVAVCSVHVQVTDLVLAI